MAELNEPFGTSNAAMAATNNAASNSLAAGDSSAPTDRKERRRGKHVTLVRAGLTRDEKVDNSDDTDSHSQDANVGSSSSRVRHLGWSAATWSQIKLDVPPREPFQHNVPQEKHVPQVLIPKNVVPYGKDTLVNLFYLYPSVPPDDPDPVYGAKARGDSIGPNSSSKTKPGVNYCYQITEPSNCRGWYKVKRHGTLKRLHQLLDRVAEANLDKVDLMVTKQRIKNDFAVKDMRRHQGTLNDLQSEEFVSFIALHHEIACERMLRNRKHKLIRDYYHPQDCLVRGDQSESIARQLSTFTEENVNTWTITEDDPTIICSSDGAYVLETGEDSSDKTDNESSDESSDEDLPRHKPVVLDFPVSIPRDDQPGYAEAMKAFSGMQIRTNIANKNQRDWEAYAQSQVTRFGEEYLGGGEIVIRCCYGRAWSLFFKLKENPFDFTLAFFQDQATKGVSDECFLCVLKDIKERLVAQCGILGSPYRQYLDWKRDLALRKLRREIGEKLQRKWYFVLQHIPPVELEPKTTHCAHPYCDHHDGSAMPAGAYRLNFLHKRMVGNPECWLDEIKDTSDKARGIPGRAEDGQMWFCLTCMEDLFNGVGLVTSIDGVDNSPPTRYLLWHRPGGNIKAEWKLSIKDTAEDASGIGYKPRSQVAEPEVHTTAPASGEHLTALEKPACPPSPHRDSWFAAPGLDAFAAHLSTFIKPEIRYTSHGFYTLNSYEYFALMKWKNMCTRKSMWEIPTNQAFCRQIPSFAVKYDFINFFGDDVIDQHEPKPLIVAGEALIVQPVSCDDISTLDDCDGSVDMRRPGMVKATNGKGTRVVKPLSQIMKIVDDRVRNAWADMDPPYTPQKPEIAIDISQHLWPPQSFWESYFQRQLDELKQAAQRETIERNYKRIDELMKAFQEHSRRPSTASRPSRIVSTPPSLDKDDGGDSLSEDGPDSPSNLVGPVGGSALPGKTSVFAVIEEDDNDRDANYKPPSRSGTKRRAASSKAPAKRRKL